MLVNQGVCADGGGHASKKGGPPSTLDSSLTGEKKQLVPPHSAPANNGVSSEKGLKCQGNWSKLG